MLVQIVHKYYLVLNLVIVLKFNTLKFVMNFSTNNYFSIFEYLICTKYNWNNKILNL